MQNWNTQLEYLIESRKGWFNPDYIEFLVKQVWKIDKPVRVADFGCGWGFLGSVLLPNLPKGSSYTGFDMAEALLAKGREAFEKTEYNTRFIHCDLTEEIIVDQYDIVICQAFLMHLVRPEAMMQTMINAAKKGGLVICMEPNWNTSNAAMYIDGLDIDGYSNLGLLAKLWKQEKATVGSDKCIGTKVATMMQKQGLKQVAVRMNDCARFLNPGGDPLEYQKQLSVFYADGWNSEMGEESVFVKRLCQNGITAEEASHQYRCEKEIHDYVRSMGNQLMALIAPPLYISYGIK